MWRPQAATVPLHLESIKVCTVIRCQPIVLSDRVEYGTDWSLLGGLPEETCVRSRAETRASIAQNLEERE